MAHILVTDDDDDIRMLLTHILTSAGHTVTPAAGGRQALATLAASPAVDLLVLDVQMPDMDGWDTLAAIRADPATQDLAVLLCTVKGRPPDLVRGWELGCDGYVSKPFDIEHLARSVERVLGRDVAERRRDRSAAMQAVRREMG